VSARLTRARRLLAVEATRVKLREREVVAARRELEERERAAATLASEAAAAAERMMAAANTGEMSDAHAHARTLERRAQRASLAVSDARHEVAARESAAVDARTDERKMEVLAEGFEAADAARARRAERKISDEHASRKRAS